MKDGHKLKILRLQCHAHWLWQLACSHFNFTLHDFFMLFWHYFRLHWFVAVSFQFPFIVRCMMCGPVFVSSAGFRSGGRKCFDPGTKNSNSYFLNSEARQSIPIMRNFCGDF